MGIADTDIVSRIEIGLDTADLDAAMEALRPVVRAVRAWRLEVGPPILGWRTGTGPS